jgi:hypothetical protein
MKALLANILVVSSNIGAIPTVSKNMHWMDANQTLKDFKDLSIFDM